MVVDELYNKLCEYFERLKRKDDHEEEVSSTFLHFYDSLLINSNFAELKSVTPSEEIQKKVK